LFEITVEEEDMVKPTILVTGGAGFIGAHVVRKLLTEGYRVTVVDDLSTGRRSNVPSDVSFHQLQLPSEALEAVIEREQPDTVVHLAAQVSAARSVTDPLADARVNALGTLQLLESCQQTACSVVHTSSAGVYGEPGELPITEDQPHDPRTPYGLHKHLVGRYLEFYNRERGLSYSNLHLANVYGPGESSSRENAVVPTFVTQVLRGAPVTVHGDGLQTRDFVYVNDVAQAVLEAVEQPANRSVNISAGRGVSLLELVELLSEVVGLPTEVTHEPERAGDIRHSVLSNELARKLWGWQPQVELKTGLLETMAHAVQNMELEGFRRQAVMGAIEELELSLAETAAANPAEAVEYRE
jgi:UDP-glucose 4-epimerase